MAMSVPKWPSPAFCAAFKGCCYVCAATIVSYWSDQLREKAALHRWWQAHFPFFVWRASMLSSSFGGLGAAWKWPHFPKIIQAMTTAGNNIGSSFQQLHLGSFANTSRVNRQIHVSSFEQYICLKKIVSTQDSAAPYFAICVVQCLIVFKQGKDRLSSYQIQELLWEAKWSPKVLSLVRI